MDDVPGMIRPDLQALPQVRDRMTFLYLEHCTLGRQDGAITVTDEKGIVPGGGHFGAAARPRHPCDPPCMPVCTGWPMRSLWRWGVRRGWDSCTSGMSALSCTTLPTCTRRR